MLQDSGSCGRWTGNTAARIEMDFNPVADHVRLIVAGSTNLGWRANSDTGALVGVDTPVDFAAGDPLIGTGRPLARR